jgi:multisubunit Na+/H+ antiporter MnhF subunit
MMTIAAFCLLILIVCMAALLYRLFVGPDAINRLLVFDLLGALVSLSLALLAILRQTWIYVEIGMGIAVLSVVATIAVAHFIERERIF